MTAPRHAPMLCALILGLCPPALAQQPPREAPAAPMLPGVSITAPAAKPADAADRAAAAERAAEAAEATETNTGTDEAEAPQGTPTEAPLARPDGGPRSLVAAVTGTDGTAMGQVALTESASGLVYASLMLENLPAGIHAVHLHETGTCEPPAFTSAGGHIAGGRAHGILNPDGPHPGDLPNIQVPDSGIWRGDLFLFGLTMDAVADADGSAVIIREGGDDYHSDPDGGAGAGIACGSFGAATN